VIAIFSGGAIRATAIGKDAEDEYRRHSRVNGNDGARKSTVSGRETIIIGVFAEGPGEGLFAKSPSPDPAPKEVSQCSVLRI